MGRILAIDYGVKRTGVAVSDPLRLIAGGLDTLDTKTLERWVVEYCSKNDVSTIVVGMPKHTNSSEPSQTWKYIEPLVHRLKRAHPTIDVVLYDERYTSVLAQRTILESGIGKMARRNKALVDKVSATIILQSYMESREYKSGI
ncbi:MAG: Holliday junction resolvase RuvX [Rikenellaceae bacterium]